MILLNKLETFNDEYKSTEDKIVFGFLNTNYLIEVSEADTSAADVFVSEYRYKMYEVPKGIIEYNIPSIPTEPLQYYEDSSNIIYVIYFHKTNNMYFVTTNKVTKNVLQFSHQKLLQSISQPLEVEYEVETEEVYVKPYNYLNFDASNFTLDDIYDEYELPLKDDYEVSLKDDYEMSLHDDYDVSFNENTFIRNQLRMDFDIDRSDNEIFNMLNDESDYEEEYAMEA